MLQVLVADPETADASRKLLAGQLLDAHDSSHDYASDNGIYPHHYHALIVTVIISIIVTIIASSLNHLQHHYRCRRHIIAAAFITVAQSSTSTPSTPSPTKFQPISDLTSDW